VGAFESLLRLPPCRRLNVPPACLPARHTQMQADGRPLPQTPNKSLGRWCGVWCMVCGVWLSRLRLAPARHSIDRRVHAQRAVHTRRGAIRCVNSRRSSCPFRSSHWTSHAWMHERLHSLLERSSPHLGRHPVYLILKWEDGLMGEKRRKRQKKQKPNNKNKTPLTLDTRRRAGRASYELQLLLLGFYVQIQRHFPSCYPIRPRAPAAFEGRPRPILRRNQPPKRSQGCI
jgi:hypothetical protein